MPGDRSITGRSKRPTDRRDFGEARRRQGVPGQPPVACVARRSGRPTSAPPQASAGTRGARYRPTAGRTDHQPINARQATKVAGDVGAIAKGIHGMWSKIRPRSDGRRLVGSRRTGPSRSRSASRSASFHTRPASSAHASRRMVTLRRVARHTPSSPMFVGSSRRSGRRSRAPRGRMVRVPSWRIVRRSARSTSVPRTAGSRHPRSRSAADARHAAEADASSREKRPDALGAQGLAVQVALTQVAAE